MASIDLKRIYREQYTAKPTPSIVELPERPFLIYLSDPRKTDTAKLRTIVRQPFTNG